jgi:hypothetical protein
MNVRWNFLSLVTLAAMAATPSSGQEVDPMVAPGDSGTHSPVSIPDLSGSWSHLSLNGLELPLSGPGPLRNRSRRLIEPQVGVGDGGQLVGDYTNPILQPWAAEVVKKFGDISLAGEGYPTPRNQCWPEQVPFVFANFGMQILQRPDKITFLYPFDHQFRQARLNQPHPANLTPTWYGDSVGHYEDDTLVVDTVGIKVGPFSMIDWYGTPFTEGLHVVERYRLLDYEATKEAIKRDAKENFQFDDPDNGDPDNGSPPDPNYKGNGLQIHVTIEDQGAFTTSWSATVTLRRALEERLERVCAENLEWYPGKKSAVPTADNPDF